MDVNLCLDKTCLPTVPSQTVSSDLMNSDLTSKLTTDDLLVSKNIFKRLKLGQNGIPVGPTEILNQDNLLGMQESKGSQEQLNVHKDFKLNLQSYPETVYSNDLKYNPSLPVDSMSNISKTTSTVALHTISPTQSLPIQTSFPKSVLMPHWTYYTDNLPLTSDFKKEFRTSSEWPTWELQPSVHNREPNVAGQWLPITTSLTLSSLESIPAPPQLVISGEFLSFNSINF